MQINKSPLVSVLMPFHNEIRFVKQRIKNLNKLRYTNKEIIFSNNSSSDGTATFIKQKNFNFKNFCLLNQKKEISPEKNWEKALKKSKGKYVMFAAMDDFHDPLFLQKGVAFLEKNSKYDCWMPQIKFINFLGKRYTRDIKNTVILPVQNMSYSTRLMYCIDGNTNFFPYALFQGNKLRKTPLAELMATPSFEQPFLFYIFCKFNIYVDSSSLLTYRLKINVPHKIDLQRKIPDRIENNSPYPPYHVVPEFKRLLSLAKRIYVNQPLLRYITFGIIVVGILRSSWCSKEWYGRVKNTLWSDICQCAKNRRIADLAILLTFTPLKIKPLRILLAQHRKYST